MFFINYFQKGIAISFLAASFSATAFLFQRWWQDFQNLAFSHLEYIIAYLLVAGLVSFGVCYYKGPVSNPRLLDLIKWSIQLLSVVLIYSGTQISVVSGTIVLCVVLSNFVPSCGLCQRLRRYWYVCMYLFIECLYRICDYACMYAVKDHLFEADMLVEIFK